MAAPKFAPVPPTDDAMAYKSPQHVPASWKPDRPAEIRGFQPEGGRLGFQGPDQGYGLKLANSFRDRLEVQPRERRDDVIAGCLGVALRRASIFSRAPVVHDFTIAFTVWGFLDPAPPAELVAWRQPLFEGLANTVHHYDAQRTLVDRIPESTLRLTPQQAQAAYPAQWRALLDVKAS